MAALLDAFPVDVPGRWSRIRAFISQWNGVDLDAESVPVESQHIDSFPLALSMRHWIGLLEEAPPCRA